MADLNSLNSELSKLNKTRNEYYISYLNYRDKPDETYKIFAQKYWSSVQDTDAKIANVKSQIAQAQSKPTQTTTSSGNDALSVLERGIKTASEQFSKVMESRTPKINQQQTQPGITYQKQEEKPNMVLWAGIGVVALAIFYMITRRD